MNNTIKYAGFFIRLIALLLDAIVAFILLSIIKIIFTIDSSNAITIVMVLFWWLYSSLMLSSSWEATLGKKLMSIRVLSLDMKRLSFKQATLRYVLSLVSTAFILPVLMMFFTKKRQTFYDYFAKSLVIDNAYKYEGLDDSIEYATPSNRLSLSILKKAPLLRVIFVILLVVASIPFIFIFGQALITALVFAYIGYGKQQAYNQSFYTKYTIEDYNDSNIIYYNSELERYMKDFIEADDIYTKFSTDTKVDIALACIDHFTQHYEAGYTKSNFRVHARNKYANDEDKIDKAKENSRFMSHNFYTYDFNTVSHIIDDVIEPSPITKRSLCDQRESVEELYKIFIPRYIPKYKNFMKPSKEEKEPQKRHVKWLKSLKEKHPKYFTNKEIKIKAQKETEHKIYLDAVEKAKSRELNSNREKYDNAIKRKKNPIISAIVYKQNDELDRHIAEGKDLNAMSDSQYPRTALYIATLNNNTYAVQTLLTNGVDVYKMNSRDSYNGFLWAFSDSKVNEEIVNLYFDYNIDVNYQYKKGETALTLAAKGCNKFKKVQQLLEHGADPDLRDLYGQTTRSGLSRYCRNKDDYKKMMKLIESNDSFFKW